MNKKPLTKVEKALINIFKENTTSGTIISILAEDIYDMADLYEKSMNVKNPKEYQEDLTEFDEAFIKIFMFKQLEGNSIIEINKQEVLDLMEATNGNIN